MKKNFIYQMLTKTNYNYIIDDFEYQCIIAKYNIFKDENRQRSIMLEFIDVEQVKIPCNCDEKPIRSCKLKYDSSQRCCTTHYVFDKDNENWKLLYSNNPQSRYKLYKFLLEVNSYSYTKDKFCLSLDHKCICSNLKQIGCVMYGDGLNSATTTSMSYLCLAFNHICQCGINEYGNNTYCKSSNHNCICQRRVHYIKSNIKSNIKCYSTQHPCLCDTDRNYCISDRHNCVCLKYGANNCQSDNHLCLCEKMPTIRQSCKSQEHPCTCNISPDNQNILTDTCNAFIHQCHCLINRKFCRKIENHDCSCIKCINSNDNKCKANSEHPCTCQSYLKQDGISDFTYLQCQSQNHLCICSSKTTNINCLANRHPCICNKNAKLENVNCQASSHPCICNEQAKYAKIKNNCQSKIHICSCNTIKSIRSNISECLLHFKHICICPKDCNSNEHDCICGNNIEYICKTINHNCICNFGKNVICQSIKHNCICINKAKDCKSIEHKCICQNKGADCGSIKHICVCDKKLPCYTLH